MHPFFRTLGDRVAEAWARAEHAPAALPALAAAALQALPAHEHITLGAFLDALSTASEPDVPHQRDLSSAFAEPGTTVYQGRGFCIEVNLWVDGTTLIHGHGFSGAFQVLHGASLESRYRFERTEALGAHMVLGALELVDIRPLGPGDVGVIPAGDDGIHALFHTERPSATVVIRTHGDRSSLPQLNLHPPGVAFDAAWPEALTPLETRQLQLVRSLLRFEGDEGRVRTIIQGARPIFAYPLISEVIAPALLQPGTSLAAMETAMARWFSWVTHPAAERLHAAAARRLYTRGALQLREVLTATEDRRTAGLLLTAPDRSAIEAFAATHLGQTGVEVVTAFIDRVGAIPNPFHPTANVLGLDPGTTAHLRARIRGAAPPEGPAAEVDRQLTTMSIFASWFR